MLLKNNKSVNVILFLAIGTLVSIFILTTHKNNPPAPAGKNTSSLYDTLSGSGKRSFASIKGLAITETIDNNTSLKITAEKADVRNKKMGFLRVALNKVTEMEKVSVTFFENNAEAVTISSDLAIIDMATRNIQFERNVQCTTSKGATLKTDDLFWDTKRKLLSTGKGYVYSDKSGSSRKGQGFESDIKLKGI